MKSERLKRLRDAYEAMAAGDLDRAMRFAADEIEYHNPADAVEPGVRRGKEEVTAAVRRLLEQFAYDSTTIEEAVEVGDALVARVRAIAVGRTSGVPIDASFGHLTRWDERDRMVHFEWFVDPNAALAAVGVKRWPSGWGEAGPG